MKAFFSKYTLFFLYAIDCSLSQSISECGNTEIQKLCLDQETCDACLQVHFCCVWCYDEKYNNRKCNVKSQLEGCNKEKIESNSQDGYEIHQNDPFTVINGDTNLEEIVQIKPQQARVMLRKGVPLNFTFTYKPAENYPLDLYYLGDLSLSMSQNLQVFKSLGKDLPGNLTQLTKNYKLAYGTFVDKPGMPFYFTDPISYENPCNSQLLTCEKGYLFRHRLNFTRNTDTFLDKVDSSQLTANVDDLDGALDAILQILSCQDVVGFSKNSRKIILLPTDSLLHSAGDGILVGATLKATDKCLLNERGEHSQPLTYDYPSLEQIEMLLRQKKVNIIFAVKTKTKLYYYTNMTQDSLGGLAYVAELEEQSENILDLIRSGFYSFAEQVSFSINKSEHVNFDFKFYADCENQNIFNETSTCYHVKNEPVTFKVQLTLKEIPLGRESDTLYIEEKNINERVQLSVEYLGTCKCKNYDNTTIEDCKNGTMRCGQCNCNSGWTGSTCDEKCDDFDITACRVYKDGIPSKVCHANGECICGKCACEPPFTGQFCQHQCPSRRNNREIIICGGPSKGNCLDGECICKPGYKGEDCSCSTSQRDCIFGGSAICSGKGECVCNQCKCQVGNSGKYCELFISGDGNRNNTICQILAAIVKEHLISNGTNRLKRSDTSDTYIRIIDESFRNQFTCSESGDYDKICSTSIYEGNSLCTLEYCYLKSEDDDDISVVCRKTCTMTAGIKSLFLAVIVVGAILVFGLIGIISYKVKLYKQDQAEYKEFMEEEKNAVEMNPIYISPVTEYTNPLRTKSD